MLLEVEERHELEAVRLTVKLTACKQQRRSRGLAVPGDSGGCCL